MTVWGKTRERRKEKRKGNVNSIMRPTKNCLKGGEVRKG
jgi:hypothetical protein